jgi:hypothetical protein
MKRVWWMILGMDRFTDADGSIDRPCYGIFPAQDTAEEVAEYFATVGTETEIVEVEADWSKAVAKE